MHQKFVDTFFVDTLRLKICRYFVSRDLVAEQNWAERFDPPANDRRILCSRPVLHLKKVSTICGYFSDAPEKVSTICGYFLDAPGKISTRYSILIIAV